MQDVKFAHALGKREVALATIALRENKTPDEISAALANGDKAIKRLLWHITRSPKSIVVRQYEWELKRRQED